MDPQAKIELKSEIKIDIIFKMVVDHLLNVSYRTYITPLNGGGIKLNGEFLKFPKDYAKTFRITANQRGLNEVNYFSNIYRVNFRGLCGRV